VSERLTIGQVSRRTGVPSKAIRFYESQGVIAKPARAEAGYRLYTPTDVRWLRLARRARLLGLALSEVKLLVEQAFTSECSEFAEQALVVIATQREQIRRQIAELEALESELDDLERHVQLCKCELEPVRRMPVRLP
jgi:MerR family copper efflux transcriptional regulator